MTLSSDQNSRLALLRDKFSAALAGEITPHAALQALLIATGARAVGMWQLVGSDLRQWGFAACHDMPAQVANDFATATLCVPVSKDGLGIVRAVNTKLPTVATLEPEKTGLPGSAGWIARFEATHSLSAPLLDSQGNVRGALAVSTCETLDPASNNWTLIVALADFIAAKL